MSRSAPRLAPRAGLAALLLVAACGEPAPRVAGRYVLDDYTSIYASTDPFRPEGDLAGRFGQREIFSSADRALVHVSPTAGEQGKEWFTVHSDSTRTDIIGYVRASYVLVPEGDRDAELPPVKLVGTEEHGTLATVRPARVWLAPNPASRVVSTLPEGARIEAGATGTPHWVSVRARSTAGQPFVLGFVRREDVTFPNRLTEVTKETAGCSGRAALLVREARDEAIAIDAAEEERNGPVGTGRGARERRFTAAEQLAIDQAVTAYAILQRDCPQLPVDG